MTKTNRRSFLSLFSGAVGALVALVCGKAHGGHSVDFVLLANGLWWRYGSEVPGCMKGWVPDWKEITDPSLSSERVGQNLLVELADGSMMLAQVAWVPLASSPFKGDRPARELRWVSLDGRRIGSRIVLWVEFDAALVAAPEGRESQTINLSEEMAAEQQRMAYPGMWRRGDLCPKS